MPPEIAITRFKAQCLELLEEVSRTGTGFVITKRGKPLAQVSPARKPRSLKGTVKFNVPME